MEDTLEVTVSAGETVEGVVGLTEGADETGEGVGLTASGGNSLLVNIRDGDLDGGVVLGGDQTVSGRAVYG